MKPNAYARRHMLPAADVDFERYVRSEEGIGVVEVILILVVLIALVIIFKNQITGLVQRIFGNISSGVNTVID